MMRMRVEPYGVGSYIHVIKRGARGMPIVGDEFDKQRFLRILYYMNDDFLEENWDRLSYNDPFTRPDWWPKRKPLVDILGYTLMPNHIHCILQEIKEGGVSTFMRKIGQSMTNHHNEKYHEHGSLFQGSYRSRTIQSDTYLRYAISYVTVKNTFELYPKGGLREASLNFKDAWQWGCMYPYTSLGVHVGARTEPTVHAELFKSVFANVLEFKKFSQDVILGGKWLDTGFE